MKDIITRLQQALDVSTMFGFLADTWAKGLNLATWLGAKIMAGFSYLGGMVFTAGMVANFLLNSWEIFRNKNIRQRKTHYLANGLSIGILTLLTVISAGVLVLNPITVPLLFAGFLAINTYREIYVYKQILQEIAEKRTKLKELTGRAELTLAEKTERLTLSYDISALEIRQQTLKTTFKVRIVMAIAIGLFIGSIFCPPLALAASVIFFGAAMFKMQLDKEEKSQLADLEANKEKALTSLKRAENKAENQPSLQQSLVSAPRLAVVSEEKKSVPLRRKSRGDISFAHNPYTKFNHEPRSAGIESSKPASFLRRSQSF